MHHDENMHHDEHMHGLRKDHLTQIAEYLANEYQATVGLSNKRREATNFALYCRGLGVYWIGS